MTPRGKILALVLAAAVSALSACDSAEERAEKYYKSGVSYLEAGDVDRALVEFRNVFKLNGRHKEARLAYARAERDRGNLREAFSQYLRLIEQYPDNLEGQIALAQLAVQAANWPEADRYADAAIALAPDDPEARSVRTVIDYGKAVEKGDTAALKAAAEAAERLLKEVPGDTLLRRVVIDSALRDGRFADALAQIDEAIKASPDDRSLYAARLSVFAAQKDAQAVEAGLRDMVERFPDAPEMSEALVRWYVARREPEKAEAHLRDQVARNKTRESQLALVQFLGQYRGPQAAVAELDRIMATDPSPIYSSARAAFLFDSGDQQKAIADLQAIVSNATPSDETRKIKIALARMKAATGDSVGARSLVEQVLAEDSGEVEALKLKANWLILDDNVGDAITVLRRALDQNPRDASVMTLMAQAYERDGNRDLMREMLALAVDASNRGPDESLRYAQFLAGEDKLLPAEDVLIEALRLTPGDPRLLMAIGDIYVRTRDWPRAIAVADELDRIAGSPEITVAAAGLRTAALQGQERSGDALDYLESLANSGEGGLAPKIAILRTHLANGDNAKALAYSRELLSQNPQDPSLRFIDASVRAATGDEAGAEQAYRALATEDASRVQAWLALYRLLASQPGREGEAGQVLEQGLAASPDNVDLLWAKAGHLERAGDVDGAIAIYETLYARNSANPIVANNLASLLSNYREDAESLNRAEVIARRLRGSNEGAFQDTYGWIAYRRGNFQEAAAELKRAAQNLPQDPSVQYHLAMAYLSLGDKPQALAQFQKVLALVAPDDSRPFVAETRDQVTKLTSEGIVAAD
ncbi:MAG: tetratricopeptide repeat protein [Pseudomonadota bacterium]